jgi:hypothetical protein
METKRKARKALIFAQLIRRTSAMMQQVIIAIVIAFYLM